MMNNYKHNLLKRVDSMTNEEVFDAIAGPEHQIKLIRKRTWLAGIVICLCWTPFFYFVSDTLMLKLFAAIFLILWQITHIFWGRTIDSIMEVGARYRSIIGDMQEYWGNTFDGEEWKNA